MKSAIHSLAAANAYRLQEIRRQLPAFQLVYEPAMESTSDRALEHCRTNPSSSPVLFLTSCQTCGRGRGSNRWLAAEGSVTFSIVLEWPSGMGSCGQAVTGRLSLAMGQAICQAAADFGATAMIKWPNDVMLQDKKLSGVLIETVRSQRTIADRALGASSRQLLVIGCGLNGNNLTSELPSLGQIAISLSRFLGCWVDLTGLLVALTQRMLAGYRSVIQGEEADVEYWRRHNWLADKQVVCRTAQGDISGRVVDIDASARLVLACEDQLKTVFSGTVEIV